MSALSLTLFNDPGCPFGYSAWPMLRTLEWRYGDQLDWRLVLIGLTEDAQQYIDRGYTPLKSALGNLEFERYGMPFAVAPKASVSATAPACRVIAAARFLLPGSEWRVLRALQFAQFTTPILMQDLEAIKRILATLDGIDAEAVIEHVNHPEVEAAYQADHAETRTAEGSAGALQGKTANTDGVERYTAPSIIFKKGAASLEATGFQPTEAYDVLIANLDPTLNRRGAASDPIEALHAMQSSVFGAELSTAEIAHIMRDGNTPVDLEATRRALVSLLVDGKVKRVDLGNDALWSLA